MYENIKKPATILGWFFILYNNFKIERARENNLGGSREM